MLHNGYLIYGMKKHWTPLHSIVLHCLAFVQLSPTCKTSSTTESGSEMHTRAVGHKKRNRGLKLLPACRNKPWHYFRCSVYMTIMKASLTASLSSVSFKRCYIYMSNYNDIITAYWKFLGMKCLLKIMNSLAIPCLQFSQKYIWKNLILFGS